MDSYEKELTGEIGKGNFDGLLVLEYITIRSEEGEVVVKSGNFQQIGTC